MARRWKPSYFRSLGNLLPTVIANDAVLFNTKVDRVRCINEIKNRGVRANAADLAWSSISKIVLHAPLHRKSKKKPCYQIGSRVSL